MNQIHALWTYQWVQIGRQKIISSVPQHNLSLNVQGSCEVIWCSADNGVDKRRPFIVPETAIPDGSVLTASPTENWIEMVLHPIGVTDHRS